MKQNQFEAVNCEPIYIGATEVAQTMGISLTYAYRIIKKLNCELEEKGLLVISGRTNRRYFFQKINGVA